MEEVIEEALTPQMTSSSLACQLIALWQPWDRDDDVMYLVFGERTIT
jgi:hypothetical protein